MKLFGRANAEETRGPGVEPKQRVELKIRGVGRTAGHVDRVDDGSMVILLVVSATAEAQELRDPDAILEFTGQRGMYRQKGVARFDVNGGSAVRFVSQEEPELVQRRDFVRVDVNIPVSVSMKDNPWPTEFDALNLSGNGVLLSKPQGGTGKLHVGMFVWLRIPLYDGKEPIEVRGSVVREAAGGKMGVRFDHISEAHQERLVHYVAREERKQRKKDGV
jgi:c-di-GMP-binding flagellar brake protein YcgR